MTNQNGIKDHGHCYRCFSTLIQLLRLRNFNRMLSLLLIRRRGRLLGRLGCGLIWRSCICCRFEGGSDGISGGSDLFFVV